MSRRRESLVKADALRFRRYFKEVLKLYGIDGMYYQVKEGTAGFNSQGEFSALYEQPVPCQMLFDQVPKISTLKKLGWTSELDQNQPIIYVDFDLPGICMGALFSIEDPLRPGKGRLFRVTKLQVDLVYPSSVACQIVAVLGDSPENTLQPNTAIERNRQKGMEVTRPDNYD